jgi:hypothetical protein
VYAGNGPLCGRGQCVVAGVPLSESKI